MNENLRLNTLIEVLVNIERLMMDDEELKMNNIHPDWNCGLISLKSIIQQEIKTRGGRMNFMEAVEAMKQGKKTKHDSDTYFYEKGQFYVNNKVPIYSINIYFEAVDWEVVE